MCLYYCSITVYSPRATRTLQDCMDNNVEIANFILVSFVCMYVYVCVHVTGYVHSYLMYTMIMFVLLHGLHSDRYCILIFRANIANN